MRKGLFIFPLLVVMMQAASTDNNYTKKGEERAFIADKEQHFLHTPKSQSKTEKDIRENIVLHTDESSKPTSNGVFDMDLRENDIHNSIADISALALSGNRNAIEGLILVGLVSPSLIPGWINPYELLVEYNLIESEFYLYALIFRNDIKKALVVAEERYDTGDIDAGMHLALILAHDSRFLKDQDTIHFSNFSIENDIKRAETILTDICSKNHVSACEIMDELRTTKNT